MSADNGVYVLLTETDKGPEYRVMYAQAIDNIYGKFNDELGKYEGDVSAITSTFGEADVFHSLNEALDHAEWIAEDYEFLEDGICVISDFKDLGYIFG